MNLRYLFRLTLAFISKFKGVLFLAILGGVGLFLFLNVVISMSFSSKTEKIGVVGRHTTEDLPVWVLRLISNGLTKLNEQGIAEGSIAKSWEALDNGKTWKFTLNDNLVWQDGEKITSKDISYSFEDVVVEKPDDKTVIFKLQNPFAPFPVVVSKPVFKKGLLGNGEFEVEKLSIAGSVIEEIILKNKSQVKKIIRFYPTEERLKLAYKLGEIDVIEDLFDIYPFNDWTNTLDIERNVNLNRYVAVFFNLQDPKLGDKKLRQALSYAIDKDSLSPDRALGPISPKSWGYNIQVKPYDFDLKRAKELIGDEKLNISLITTPILLESAEKIAKNWEEIGVTTQISVSSILPSEYQAFLAIYDIPTDPDQYSTWHSTQTETNITNYGGNPRIDKLLEDGRQELNFENRKKIYLDFQRFLLEDAPAAFLYHPVSFNILRK